MDLLICGAHHQKWDIKGLICTVLIIVLYIVNISFWLMTLAIMIV